MTNRIALAFLAGVLLTPLFPARAEVPQTREQIQLSFAPLVKKVGPAVVNIYTKRVVSERVRSPFMDDPFFAPFFRDDLFGGRMRKHLENALGSGVIVAPDGLVVTNAHVVRDAQEITVVLADGREFESRLVLKDDASDLALLRIDPKGESLPHVTLKPSESLDVGDLVLAFGNPFGVGQTVTSGIVSALARSTLDINDFNFFIQTDAAINPGNSGGPLVALDGGVVGINSAIYSRGGGSLGIGFAIPSEMVASVIAAEKTGAAGKNGVARAWLGVTAQAVTADIAASLGFTRPQGALIAALHPASPLAKAGLAAGDIVLGINGKALRDPSEMKFRMATIPIGGHATFEARRKTETIHADVQAILPPEDPPRQKTALKGDHPLNGAVIVNVSPAVATELGLHPDDSGVAVADVARGSYAARLIVPGTIIKAVNGRKVKTVGDVQEALKNPDPRGWQILIERDGRTSQVIIR